MAMTRLDDSNGGQQRSRAATRRTLSHRHLADSTERILPRLPRIPFPSVLFEYPGRVASHLHDDVDENRRLRLGFEADSIISSRSFDDSRDLPRNAIDSQTNGLHVDLRVTFRGTACLAGCAFSSL